MRLTAARITIAAFLFVTPSAAESETQNFTLGRVDLLSLALALPEDGKRAPTIPEQAQWITYRALRAEVTLFLKREVERVARRAQWKIRTDQGPKASYPEIPRETDVVTRTIQESMSSKGSFYGEGWTGLLTGLGLIGLSTAVASLPSQTERAKIDAQACASFLEQSAPKVRRFHDSLPETDELVPEAVLAGWVGLAGEIRADRRCARLRGF